MNNRKVFHDSVAELPEQPGITPTGLNVSAARPEFLQDKMNVSFSLAIAQEAHDDLEAKVAAGQVVPAKELTTNYAVPQADVDALVAWLKGEGFEVTHVSNDRTSVFARATAAQIEKSLGVQMVRVTKNGLTYTAARNAPSLPADIAKNVHAIGGLQPYRHAHKHLRRGAVRTLAPTPAIANQPPYLVPEILKAYNADGLPVTGKGQTIAILIDTFPLDTDLQLFWERNRVRVTLDQIQKINVGGGQLPAVEGEETLDVSWASGIAPGATVRVYASGSLQFTELDIALDRILSDVPSQPGMRQLSISMGLGETFMVPGEVRTEHQKFLRLAAVGVNVFVSSGDAGSNPDGTGQMSGGPLQAEYAASDTAVIGVGGTSLVLNANGSVAEETGWPGSGGGKSKFFKRPPWQKGAGMPSGTQRLVPDVSLTADPNEGVFLILNGQPFPSQLGGTSWSAPVWAGFCALINEARAKASKPPLPFLNPLIYPLLGSASFRDIVDGNNGVFDAGPGYDMVTGVGVPDIRQLIAALT
jgi:kumamolisin